MIRKSFTPVPEPSSIVLFSYAAVFLTLFVFGPGITAEMFSLILALAVIGSILASKATPSQTTAVLQSDQQKARQDAQEKAVVARPSSERGRRRASPLRLSFRYSIGR